MRKFAAIAFAVLSLAGTAVAAAPQHTKMGTTQSAPSHTKM